MVLRRINHRSLSLNLKESILCRHDETLQHICRVVGKMRIGPGAPCPCHYHGIRFGPTSATTSNASNQRIAGRAGNRPRAGFQAQSRKAPLSGLSPESRYPDCIRETIRHTSAPNRGRFAAAPATTHIHPHDHNLLVAPPPYSGQRAGFQFRDHSISIKSAGTHNHARTAAPEEHIMAQTELPKEHVQSGTKVGLGIIGFVLGTIALIWILKVIIG